MRFSVLLPVYHKDKPEDLEQAIESILDQTVFPDEVVLVKDGPLPGELDDLIGKFVQRYGRLFKILAMGKNAGLGDALRLGLDCCSNDIVARMDADDVSLPDRFEKQLEVLSANPGVDLVGAYIAEFEGSVNEINSIRTVPLSLKEIKKYSRHRNPVNHVTVMFRKAAVLRAGGYMGFQGFEDYWLWMRMLSKGCEMVNLPLVLVLVRVNGSMFRRRGGTGYVRSEGRFQRELLKAGYIRLPDFIFNIVVRGIARIIPNFTRRFVYNLFLRKKYKKGMVEPGPVN